MITDQDLLKQIAAGGPFDQVEAIRVMARALTAAKSAPAATTEMPEAPATQAKKRPAKDTAAEE